MTEIYKGETTAIYLDLLNAAADALPTATLVRADATTLSLSVSTATAPTGVVARYVATIPSTELTETGSFKVNWAMTVATVAYTPTQYYTIVVPYVTLAELSARLGWQYSDPSAAGYMDPDRTRAAELIARKIINTFAEQSFMPEHKKLTTYGNQTDVITFKERIYAVEKIVENGVTIYDTTVNPVVNYYGYTYEITETNYGLRIIAPEEGITTSNSLGYDTVEYERVSIVYEYGRFPEGFRYEVTGRTGYESVPEAIHEAAIILINELMCQDSAYQNKYVESVQTKDWRFAYSPLVWTGTGNSLVDDLISSYKIQPVWVI